jgi:hypothetical protein
MKKLLIPLILLSVFAFSCKKRNSNSNIVNEQSFKKGKDALILGTWRTTHFISGGKKLAFASDAILSYTFKSDNTFKLYTKGLEGTEHYAEGLYNCQKGSTLSKLDLYIKNVVDMNVPEAGKAYYMVYKIKKDVLYLGITSISPMEITTMEDMRPLSVDNAIVLKKTIK